MNNDYYYYQYNTIHGVHFYRRLSERIAISDFIYFSNFRKIKRAEYLDRKGLSSFASISRLLVPALF